MRLGLDSNNWNESLTQAIDEQDQALSRDEARSRLPITAELLAAKKRAEIRRLDYYRQRAKERRFEGRMKTLSAAFAPNSGRT